MLAVAEMYVKGVSTRDAARVMAEFGLEGLSSTQLRTVKRWLVDAAVATVERLEPDLRALEVREDPDAVAGPVRVTLPL